MSGFGQSSATGPAVVRSKVHLVLKDSSLKVGEQMVLRQGLAAWGAEVVIPPPPPPAVSGKSTPPWCEGVSLLGPTAASPSLAASETARSGRQALEFQVCRGEDLESDSAPAWGSGQQGRPGQTSPLPADTSRLGEGGGGASWRPLLWIEAPVSACRLTEVQAPAGSRRNGVRPTCSWVVEKRRLLPSSKASPPAAVHRKPRAPKPGQGAPGSSRDTLAWGSRADPSDPGHTRRPDCLEGSVGHPSAKLLRLRRTRSLIQAPVELESTPDAGHTPTFPQTRDTHLHLSKRRTPAYISPNEGHLAANPWQFLRAGH